MGLKLTHLLIFLIIFIKRNANFFLRGENVKTSHSLTRNSQEGLKSQGTFIKALHTLLKQHVLNI